MIYVKIPSSCSEHKSNDLKIVRGGLRISKEINIICAFV